MSAECLVSALFPKSRRMVLGLLMSHLHEADVCVYGGTAGGVAAGLAAARRGKSVIIVEPFRHLGGMHGGGIRIQQDCLYLEDIGGIARELHDADYALPGGGSANQWQARLMIRKKVEDAGIRFFTEHRLDSKDDIVKDGAAIRMIHLNYAPIMEEGVPAPQPTRRRAFSIKAKVFIDASYEGDLMAFSGCDYTVSRESRDEYGESLAGQGYLRHFDVDPYVVQRDPSSGVLPMISTEPYKPGEAYYAVDIYPPRLIAHDGKVASEGELFVRVSPGPYQIPYRALIPKQGKCTNLLVPVCMSSSHIAMASIRMESSYVVLGEAAGIAASHTVESGKSVHDVDVQAILTDMKNAGIVTEWNGKGYGPHSRKTWRANAIHWINHPEDYEKIPIRLDPSWEGYDPGSGDVRVEAFPSVEDWNRKKPNYEWLFPFIDKNADGKISRDEHQAFQDYKRKDKNWANTLKPKHVRPTAP